MKISVKKEFVNIINNKNLKSNKKVDWNKISRYEKLTEDFIREFKYLVNWTFICEYQNLSVDFILEFKHKVNSF